MAKAQDSGAPLRRVELVDDALLVTADGRPVRAASEYATGAVTADGRPIGAVSTLVDEGLPVEAMALFAAGTLVTADGRPVEAVSGYSAAGVRGTLVSVTPTTLDPAAKNAALTLSDGDLTATTAAAYWVTARATQSRAVECFFEATAGASSFILGVMNAAQTFADGDYIASSANSYGYANNDFFGSGIGSAAPGDKVGVHLFPGGAAAIRFRLNNGAWSADLSIAGLGSPVYAGVSVVSGGTVTLNLGATAFSYAPPSGVPAWDAA